MDPDTETQISVQSAVGFSGYQAVDHETGVTTHGDSESEALLMLIDALDVYRGANEDLLTLAEEVFEERYTAFERAAKSDRWTLVADLVEQRGEER